MAQQASDRDHTRSAGLRTCFAPAERASPDAVAAAAAAVNASPTMAALGGVGGILMILNRERQIVALNDDLLRFLGCERPEMLLGMRPGEALHCIHAADNPGGGCGTGVFCRSCGAAVAIVASQKENAPVETECLLTATVGERQEPFEFRVRAAPIAMGGEQLLAISLQDIRDLKRREALEAVFLHDLMNTATALQGTVGLLARCQGAEREGLIRDAKDIARRLVAEIAEQRDLADLETGRFPVRKVFLSPSEVREALEHLFAHQQCSTGKRLVFDCEGDGLMLYTDSVLLTRALTNLVKNAFEGTAPGGEVRVRCFTEDDSVVFEVWNAAAMPAEVAMQVFVRYFTTKGRRGRGLGTYGARLIAERYLGGSLSFATSEAQGTTFRLKLPRPPQ
ncbi:MAG: HAMP domain-containing histidine kinase [Planctomycetes bacterium]|nr:HAMP domain-containing histidine kinase [Planctomycetota bacterium]